MTRVTYWPEEFRLRAEGHAGAGKPGEDLVCAAITALFWTLAAAAEEIPEYRLQLHENEAKAEFELRCYPDEEQESTCGEMFRTIVAGLTSLEEEYPEFIRMDERGEGS